MVSLEKVYRSIYEDNDEEALSKILEYNSLDNESKNKANNWIRYAIHLIDEEYYDRYRDFEDDDDYCPYSPVCYSPTPELNIVDFPYNILHQAIQARRYSLVKSIILLNIYKDLFCNRNPMHTLTSIPDIDHATTLLQVNYEKQQIIHKYIKKATNMNLLSSISVSIIKEVIKGNINLSKNDLIKLEKDIEREECNIANMLLEYNNNYLNEISSEGYTSLEYALKNSNFPLVRLLISKGAVEIPTSHNLFDLSVGTGNIDTVKKIIDVYGYDKNNNNALCIAIEKKKSFSMVRFLLELGLKVDVVNKYEKTPIHCALEEGCIKILKLLLQYGASLEIKTSRRSTPLYSAIRHPDIVRLLLNNGADPNNFTNHVLTPLNKCIPTYIKSAKVMIPYIVLRKYKKEYSKGLDINLKIIEESAEFMTIYESCEKELKLLDSIRLNKCYSLKDLIVNDIESLSELAHHEKVNNIDKKVFSNYYSLLCRNVKLIKDRAKLVKNTVSQLCYWLEDTYWLLLPIEIQNKIISLLDSKNLTSIIIQISKV
ncbi:SWPV1-289 [Shearwaterpox virus]|uniref:SWPV1-289 n=1 Tax=Shearwaterpox virus TaxID=1974596 RepID=A0A1V0S8A1_CNPV|nr:SWPV1-289 [Shearwaterpox virus]